MDDLNQNAPQTWHIFLCILFFFTANMDRGLGHNFVRPVSVPDLGVLNGFYSNHSDVTAFLGVPYAQPPTGKLRFQPSEAVTWNGTREASTMHPDCIQSLPKTLTSLPTMSEDCLYLNIFVPGNMTYSNANRSVMVWINNEAYSQDYNYTQNMEFLASSGDVIVITVNYRQGIFGFLSSGDGNLPGNAGLHDLVMALKWVKVNIYPFGGDPEKITIFGQSAAALGIYALIASPNITKGLFSRAIMQSSRSWHVTGPGDAFRIVTNLTSCPHIQSHGHGHAYATRMQIECMKNKTVQELLDIELSQYVPVFGPVIDNVFLKSTILEQLATEKINIPCLIGLNKQEFVLKENETIANLDELKKRLSTLGHNSFNAMAVQLILSKFLINDLERTYLNVVNSKMLTSIQNLATLVSGTNDIFVYYLSHQSSFATSKKYAGVRSSDKLPFIFGSIFNTPSITSEEETLSKNIIAIWSSFARVGVPQLPNGIKWPPYEKTNRTYVELNVNITETNVKQRLRESDRIFWNELMPALMKMATTPKENIMTGHMTTTSGHLNHNKPGSIAWGMSEQAVQDLLLALLILLIFVTVICLTLIVILCKVRTIKLAATRHNKTLNAFDAPAVIGNDNKAFANDSSKPVPESMTAL